MSSNGEKGMMKRSDFAQKLLDDLRVRKERLSISQDTGQIQQTFPMLGLDLNVEEDSDKDLIYYRMSFWSTI